LILDWETCRAEHEDRLAAIMGGLGLSEPPRIYYRPMSRALADDIVTIRRELARVGTGLLIVDSLAPACGSEPEGADAAIRTLNALRTLPATKLVIAHVSKAAAEARGPSKAFGSAFVMNLSRNCWEIRKAEEETEDLVIGCFHRKVNRGRLLPAF